MNRLLLPAAFAAGSLICVESSSAAPRPYTAPAHAAAPAAPAYLKLQEGTEVHVRIDDALSSATATAGDRFNITLDEPIEADGGITIPAGFRGVGEVTSAEKRGHIGKAGQLNVQLDYIKVGDKRVRLRSVSATQGKSSLGNSVALTVVFGPLGLLARGADVTIAPGKKMNAYVDNDVELPMPMPAPPAST